MKDLTYQDAIDYLISRSQTLEEGRLIAKSDDIVLMAIRNETSRYLQYAADVLMLHRDEQ